MSPLLNYSRELEYGPKNFNWSSSKESEKVKSYKPTSSITNIEFELFGNIIFCVHITSTMAEIQSASVLFAKQMTYYRKGFALLYVNSFSWKAYPEKQMFCPQSPPPFYIQKFIKKETHTLANKLIFQQQLLVNDISTFLWLFKLVLPTSIIYVFCKGLLFQTV